MWRYRVVVLIVILHIFSSDCNKSFNKYTKEANIPRETDPYEFRKIESPFRTAKCNLVWAKSVQVKSYKIHESNCLQNVFLEAY